jgi:hypothetical protein
MKVVQVFQPEAHRADSAATELPRLFRRSRSGVIHAASPWLASRLVMRVSANRAAHLLTANLKRPLERLIIEDPLAHLLLDPVCGERQLGLDIRQG